MPYRVPVAGCGRIHGIISESRQRRGVVAARPTTAPRIASSPRCRALRRSIRVPHSPSRPCHVLHARKTFIISSPKWLMTLKAMRPDWGLGKGQGDVASRIEKLPSCRVAERPKNALFRIWNRTFLNYRSTVATNDISLARYESRPERLVRRLPSLHADPQLVDRPASSFHGDEQQALLYHIRAPAQCDLYVAKALA